MAKEDFKRQCLSLREAQNLAITRLRAKGLNTQQIADHVGISRQALEQRELRIKNAEVNK
jgi:DNA-binding CsgD family transcriptional regulator